MALEMKVHRDISTYQAKPMMGLTWRQLAALAIMLFGGGGVFLAVTAAILHSKGAAWSDGAALNSATSVAMYAMFPFIIPPALWAWWRPMGLKPEVYIQFAIRHALTQKVISYADTYEHRTAAAGEPVPGAGTDESSEQRNRRAERRARKEAAKRRKALSEHAPQQGGRRADRSRRAAR